MRPIWHLEEKEWRWDEKEEKMGEMVRREEEVKETSVVAEEKTTDAGDGSEAENVGIFEEWHFPLRIQIQISRAPRCRLHGYRHLSFTHHQQLTMLSFFFVFLLCFFFLFLLCFFFLFFCNSLFLPPILHHPPTHTDPAGDILVLLFSYRQKKKP